MEANQEKHVKMDKNIVIIEPFLPLATAGAAGTSLKCGFFILNCLIFYLFSFNFPLFFKLCCT